MDTLLDFGQHIALGAAGACIVIIFYILAVGAENRHARIRHARIRDEGPPLGDEDNPHIIRLPPSPDTLKSMFFSMHNHGQITAVVSRPDALRKLKGQARYKVDLVGMETFLRYVALASGWVEG